MPSFVALDGGGTKTLCLVADQQGQLLGLGLGGGANANLVSETTAQRSLGGAVMEAWQAAACPEPPALAAVSGPVGAAGPAIVRRVTGATQVIRVSEPEAAWASVQPWLAQNTELPLDTAVTVVAGTGAIAGGWNRAGAELTVGGWGWLLGDEGSGFWIGLRAIQAAIHALDGRGPGTDLLSALCPALDLSTLQALIPIVYQGRSGRQSIASLAPVVVQTACLGDAVAVEILTEAGKALAALAVTIVQKLALAAETFAVVPAGSVFKAGELILQSFRVAVLGAAPGAQMVVPRYEPVVGTLLQAMTESGMPSAGRWSRMEAQVTRIPRLVLDEHLFRSSQYGDSQDI